MQPLTIWGSFNSQARHPERVLLREGSPNIGTVPVSGDPSRRMTCLLVVAYIGLRTSNE